VFTLPEALALPLVPGVNAILSKYGSTDGSKPSTGKNMNEVTLSGRGDSPANLAEMVFFQQAVHKTAVDHGWWETGKGDTFGEKLSLMHSELSEALEAYRETGSVTKIWENPDKPGKLEGVPVELADCIIRIFDFMGHHGVDMEAVLLAKHRYNESRPYRHGGKTI
jgi:NTP pyrophosphatase (non-canonical NTP hydrolase)